MEPHLSDHDVCFGSRIPVYTDNLKRFQIVVFHKEDQYFVKRIIGLPGETIEIKQGIIYVNHEPLKDNYKKESFSTNMSPTICGDDTYFVLGDNRNNSIDSRNFGVIHKKDIYCVLFS